MIALAALLLAGDREAIGAYAAWAAFRDGAPRRCYAIAQPVSAGGATDRRGAFASVASRYGGTMRGALFLRLSQPRRAGSAITLAIGERRFALVGDAQSAHAVDAATDRAIVGAMRSARAMTVATTGARGAFSDTYPLDGAATAIDAASLACAR